MLTKSSRRQINAEIKPRRLRAIGALKEKSYVHSLHKKLRVKEGDVLYYKRLASLQSKTKALESMCRQLMGSKSLWEKLLRTRLVQNRTQKAKATNQIFAGLTNPQEKEVSALLPAEHRFLGAWQRWGAWRHDSGGVGGRWLPTETRQAGRETDTQWLLSDGDSDSVLGGFASLPPTVGFSQPMGRLSTSVMQI